MTTYCLSFQRRFIGKKRSSKKDSSSLGLRNSTAKSRKKHRKFYIFWYRCEQDLCARFIWTHLEEITNPLPYPTVCSISNTCTTGRYFLIMLLMDDAFPELTKIILIYVP